MAEDRLGSFGIYKLACQLFDEFWGDSEIVGKDYRGRELVKQQTRSLDSVCANIEEGYGRGFNKEMPQHLKIARGEVRESKGRYNRMKFLLSAETRSEEHTSELQSRLHLVCRLLLEKKKKTENRT